MLQCISCKNPFDLWRNFPLCGICNEALIACPPLCKQCGGLNCHKDPCSRPWMRQPPETRIASLNALYLMAGPGYQVLRRWKARHGPMFDRRVLRESADFIERVRLTQARWIVPMPQRSFRAWNLGGSPVEKFANWIAGKTGIRILHALSAERPALSLLRGQTRRQAQLQVQERFRNRLHLSFEPEHSSQVCDQRVVLVDDFMTTGHTSRIAARLLVESGQSKEIHLVFLGMRPEFKTSRSSD